MKQKKYQKIIPEKHVRRIRAMMILKGVTYADIARAAGTAVNTVRVVLNGFSASRRIQQAAADLLGLPYERMFRNPLHLRDNDKRLATR